MAITLPVALAITPIMVIVSAIGASLLTPNIKFPDKLDRYSVPKPPVSIFEFCYRMAKLIMVALALLFNLSTPVLSMLLNCIPFLASFVITAISITVVYIIVPGLKSVRRRANYTLIGLGFFFVFLALTGFFYSQAEFDMYDIESAEYLKEETKSTLYYLLFDPDFTS